MVVVGEPYRSVILNLDATPIRSLEKMGNADKLIMLSSETSFPPINRILFFDVRFLILALVRKRLMEGCRARFGLFP
jgi:hypothetical protein